MTTRQKCQTARMTRRGWLPLGAGQERVLDLKCYSLLGLAEFHARACGSVRTMGF